MVEALYDRIGIYSGPTPLPTFPTPFNQVLRGAASPLPIQKFLRLYLGIPCVPLGSTLSPAAHTYLQSPGLIDQMLSKVVSRLKRRFRRRDARNSQPPELRRWSDFLSPFPHVELGGYTRYYRTRGLLADRSRTVASPDPTESKQLTSALPSLPHSVSQRRLRKRVKPKAITPPTRKSGQLSAAPSPASSPSPAIPSPGIEATISSSTASCSLHHQKSASTLVVIPEEPVAPVKTGKRRRSSTRANNSESSGGSLRRKRRILRMASAEYDTLRNAYLSAIAGSLSYTLSGASAISSMSSETRFESPNATVATLVNDLGCGACKITASDDPADSGGEDYERPDSRLSFRTARSDFSDQPPSR